MVLLALLMVYVIVVFFGMFFAMFSTLCKPLYEAGLSWMYFALAGIMATLAGIYRQRIYHTGTAL